MIEREPVNSSNLVSVGYGADSETLEVEFKNGDVYQYYNVPLFMYERLRMADSLGRFFNAEIKPAFPCEKL